MTFSMHVSQKGRANNEKSVSLQVIIYIMYIMGMFRDILRCSVAVILFAVQLTMVSCGDTLSGSQKPGSSGGTLDVLLAIDEEVYSGSVKELIDSIFLQPQRALPQPEPRFDLVPIPVSSLRNTSMFQHYRNIVICDVRKGNPDKVYRSMDPWAEPQIVYEFSVADEATLCRLLRKTTDRLVDDIYNAEHRRMIKAYKGIEGYAVEAAVKKQLGISLTISNEFEVARPDNPRPDFMWVRKETKDFGIGVQIHVLPYDDPAVFTEERVLDTLEYQMRMHIPGIADGSYMNIERRLPFYTRQVTISDSLYAVETRGCWRTEGAFMGGPFVNYVVLSPDQQKVVFLTAYVYYPSGRLKSLTKRDLLMQVEGICHSLRFE